MARETADAVRELLRRRVVHLGAEVTEDHATAVIAQLLYLQSLDAAAEVTLTIDSPGGLVTASLAILDAMDSLRPPVSTWVLGKAAGTAALLLAAGSPGRRFASAGARIQLVSCQGPPGAGAPARELLRLDAEICDRLARGSGRDPTVIRAAMDRGTVLTAAEARQLGIVDGVRAS